MSSPTPDDTVAAGGPRPPADGGRASAAGQQPRSQLLAPRPGTNAIGPIAVDFGTSSSTVTMYDTIYTVPRVLWPGQAAEIARGLAALLRHGKWHGSDPRETLVRAVRATLEADGATDVPADALALARRLDSDREQEERLAADRYLEEDADYRDNRARLLMEVVRQFEELLRRTQEPAARRFLAARLHATYRVAFSVASPDAYKLTAIGLDLSEVSDSGNGGQRPARRDIPSRLVVGPDGDIAHARLQDVSDAAQEWIGHKRYLSAPHPIEDLRGKQLPAGWAGDSDLLLALSYTDLVTRTHEFLDHLGGSGGKPDYASRRIEQLTATFPTVTPPAARTRLQKLLIDALGLKRNTTVDGAVADNTVVDVSFDEATAAALYFVLRELGGDSRGGVDALRARSRQLTEHMWRRTMLVIDIGGGTTDVALLALDLTEEPVTPTPFGGRHYRLAPKVLGTTGHNQLGGELLTLRVFYWIKALLADALGSAATSAPSIAETWSADPARGDVPTAGLAPLVVGFPGFESPAPLAVRDVLRELLPTHSGRSGGMGEQTQAFRRIWNQAERAKKLLADGNDVTLDKEWLLELRYSLTCTWADAVGELAGSVELMRASDFDILARPVLERAMTLGARLARSRLREDPVLDVVALAGRTCVMAAAAETAVRVVSTTLLDDSGGGEIVRWDPGSIIVERRNAKQAASIGAAWAYSRAQFTTEDADEVTRHGDDRVDLNVDNLLLQLPCAFHLRTADTPIPLFEAGEQFDRQRSDDTRYRRSRWMAVPGTIELVRPVDGGREIRWGYFRYTAFSSAPPKDARFCIEMDQQLRPRLLIQRGTETHRSVAPASRPFEIASYLRAGLVNGQMPDIDVTLAGEPGGPVGLFAGSDRADVWMHVDIDPTAWSEGRSSNADRRLRGTISASPLPMPRDPDTAPHYRLGMRTADGLRTEICEIPVQPPSLALARQYWAALDEYGRLWVLRDEPAPLRAASIREMEHVTGSTFVTDMDDFVGDWDPVRDPYSGIH